MKLMLVMKKVLVPSDDDSACAQAVCVRKSVSQSQGSTGTAMCMLGLNSDMYVIAHVHILLKYLSHHEL